MSNDNGILGRRNVPSRVRLQNQPIKVSELEDYFHNLAEGQIPGHSVVHKFGEASVGTTYTALDEGGQFRTPQVSGATQLRIKAGGDAQDTAAGTGAREITLEGIGTDGYEISDTLITNGTSASSPTTESFLRLNRMYVSQSGTYATTVLGSHADDIIVENSAGTEDWGLLSTEGGTSHAHGQSQIGCFCVPKGKTGFIQNVTITVDSNKTADISLYRRTDILETAAPYKAMRLITESRGISGPLSLMITTPVNGFEGPCDIIFMGRVSTGTGYITVDFEIILIDD